MGRRVLMFEYSKVQALDKDALMRGQCILPWWLGDLKIPLIW